MEWEHVDEGEEAIVKFMEQSGFVNFGKIATPYARDIIFVQDYLRFDCLIEIFLIQNLVYDDYFPT